MSTHSEIKRSALRIIRAQKTQNIPIGVLFDKFEALATPTAVLELIAEIESLKKDAARYRWLRKNNIYAHVQVTQKDGSELYVYDSELDRSVDWAIYATKDHK